MNLRSLFEPATFLVVLASPVPIDAAIAESGESGALDESAWRLSALPGRALLPGSSVTLRFANGQVLGSDGCNRYRAPYGADGGSLRLSGDPVSTRMACPEPVMEQAAAFVAALTHTRALHLDGRQLVLLDGDGSTLATLAAQNAVLAGSAWQVTGYNNGQRAVVSVHAGSSLTLGFAPDGRVSGSAGCNRFSGAYTGAAQALRIDRLSTTRKLCAESPGVMAQEAAFLQALERVAAARIEAERLELRSADGALQLAATRSTAALAAAAPPGTAAAPALIGAHGLRLPATFRGDLPCADCVAIRHHLDLWPDQVFHLHREWVDRPDRRGGDQDFFRDDIGRWHLDPARQALILQGGAEMPLQFAIQGAEQLRALDLQGQPIVSELPYELHSDGTLMPADLALTLGGEVRYTDGAAWFTECLTGRSYPLVMAEDIARLERAYRESASGPDVPLYVSFEGSIRPRPATEGAGPGPAVVVHRFINAWPGMRCERARADAALTNTYWRIVRLGDAAVPAVAGRREPHLLLRAGGEHRPYNATVGCNQMQGDYIVDDDRLSFGATAATLMVCPPPLDALERQLGEVLSKTRGWRIQANTLELFDDGGMAIGLFEAVYF